MYIQGHLIKESNDERVQINKMRMRRRHQGVSGPILLSEEAASEEGSRKAPGKELIVTSVFFSDKHWTLF